MTFIQTCRTATNRFGRVVGCLVAGAASFGIAQVVVDPNAAAGNRPGIDQAPNGVPLINIAAPNGQGLSHNLYSDYNVGTNGLILNNLTGKYADSQLGGVIFGNPNLKGGAAASVILNEITGTKRSELLGFTEVAGSAAHVIVANPNGIYVNGAGFINTPRVTLTTGKPEFDAAGGLSGYRVEDGSILIDGLGLNGSETDAFDLLSRTATFAADVHVRGELRVIAGRNRIDHQTLEATPLEDDGKPKPAIAIDSSQLGGMYAGKIKLLATEKGVGVNMQGAASASAGDLIAQAKGDVRIRKASAAVGRIKVKSDDGNVEITETLAAKERSELSASKGSVKIATGARVVADGGLLLEGGTAVQIESAAIVNSITNIDLTGGSLANNGDLATGAVLNLNVLGNVANAGHLAAGTNLILNGSGLQNSGTITAENALELLIGNSISNSGIIDAAVSLTAQVGGTATNAAGAAIQSAAVTWTSVGAIQNQGTITGFDAAAISSSAVVTNDGTIEAGNLLTLTAAGLENHSKLKSLATLELRINGNSLNSGLITAASLQATVTGTSTNLTGGKIYTTQELNWNSTGLFSNAGDVVSEATATITAAPGINNLTGGSFFAVSSLALNTTALLQNAGSIASDGDLSIATQRLVNPYGQFLIAKNNLVLSIAEDLTNAGILFAGNSLRIAADGTVTNTGNILASGDLTIEGRTAGTRATAIINSSAAIESTNGSITLRGQTIENKRTELVINRGAADLGLGERQVINNFKYIYNYLGVVITNAHQLPKEFGQNAPTHDLSFKNFYRTIPEWERTNELYVQEHRYGDLLVSDTGASKIRAGQDIIFDAGSILNNASLVSARRDINIKADSFVNQGDALLTRVDTVSQQEYFEVFRVKEKDGEDVWGSKTYLANPTTETHYENGGSFHGTIEAGGVINGTITTLSNSEVKTGTVIDPSNAVVPIFLRPDGAPVSTLGPNLDTSINFLGSLGQLLIVNTDPEAHYLYETRPEFAKLGNFLGSDYFFGPQGLESRATENLLKRLGDSYFETQYVLHQLYELTGKTFLGAPQSDYDLMKRLMDAGVSAAKNLHLTPGITLTKEQYNQLDQDIVWMEERMVNGQKVLVPVVYLSASTVKHLGESSNATITAGNIDLKTGNLTNSGTIAARKVLNLDTQTLLNRGGSLLSSGSLLVNSTGDIINQSGTIKGNGVTLHAGGDLINTTDSVLRTDVTNGLASNHTQFGKIGTITSTGDLNLQAQGDIRNVGADISADGNAALHADKDVEIGGVGFTSETHLRGSNMTLNQTVDGHLASQLTFGKNLDISSGRDIAIAGGDIAVKGNAMVAATRDLSLTTLTETLQASGTSKGDGIKLSNSIDRTTELGTLFTSEGKLTLSSENDLTVRGSSAASTGDMTLKAGGDVNIIAAWQDEAMTSVVKKEGGGLFRQNSKETTVNRDHAALQSSLTTDGNFSIQSGGKTTLEAANVAAGKDLTITATGGLDLAAAETTSLEKVDSSSKGLLNKSKFGSTETWTSDIGTTLQAGNNLTLTTPGDLTATAASVFAKNDLTVTAGGILLAEEGRSTHDKDTKSKSGGFGITHTTTSTGVTSTKGYTSTKEKTHLSEDFSLLGTWEAGNNAKLTSNGDFTLQGQQVAAGKNLAVSSAAGDVNILSAIDLSEDSFKKSDFFLGSTTTAQMTGLVATVINAAEAAKDRDSGTNALQGAVTARAAYDVAQGGGAGIIGFSVSESFGYSKSEQSGSSSYTSAAASSLTAGEILDVTAKNDITVKGSDLSADQINLTAGGDILLLSQQETSKGGHDESSSNASVGATAYVILGGPTGVAYGVNVDIKVGGSQGKGETESLTHRETTLNGGKEINLTSGADTALIGAIVSADKVTVNATGDFIARSEQDIYKTLEEQASAGINLSIPLPIPGTIPANASVGGNFQDQNASGEIHSVREQTGIYAGTGGFNINVKGDTTLTAAVLASEATPHLNKLTTGSLTLTDLLNTSEWQASTTGFSGSVSKAGETTNPDGSKGTTGKTQASLTPSLGQEEGDSDSGTTRSAIAMGTITLGDGTSPTGINRDTANANHGALAMDGLPDLSKTLAQQADRAAVAQEASAAVAKTVGDLADHFASEAIASNDKEAIAAWSEGGANRAALHALTQGLVASLGGGDGLGAGLGAGLSSYLPSNLKTGDPVADQLLGNLISGGLGYAVGGNGGAFAASSVDLNNRQLHPSEYMFIVGAAKQFAKDHGISTEEAIQLLVRGALYLNDEKWKEQYDKFYPSDVASYKDAGNYVKDLAALSGFNK